MRWTLTILGVSVLVLLGGGFMLLASAGEETGRALYNSADYFVTHQAIWLGVAMVFMLTAAFFDYHNWRRFPILTICLYAVVAALMVAVLFAPETKGSHRWLRLIGSVRLQPSELGKIFVVISTAVFLDWAGWRIEKFWKGAVPAVMIVGVLMGLAVAEPDFGATMVIGLAGGMLCFIGGMRFLHMILMGGGALAAVGTLLVFNPNRMRRIVAWLPGSARTALESGLASVGQSMPTESATNNPAAYQLSQALVAISHGGPFGVGYTKSMQKKFYLPEAHTDFIFAIGAEELGLAFSLMLLTVFTVFFICGSRIALRAPDRLGRLLAFGMTFLVFFPVLFNIGVVTGCLPTKGLALPFISYGGTNLMTSMIAVGILFNIGRQIELPKPRPRSTISPVFA